jgi:hypothetical protein
VRFDADQNVSGHAPRYIQFLRNRRDVVEDSSPEQEFSQTLSMFFVPQPRPVPIIHFHGF